MRIGSLCSGYGGLEMGVQAVYGGTTAWVSDIDKGACKILAHRFPGVPNIGDIDGDWADVEPVDVLTAGYPCQPFSHAGRRKGTSDVRHLWPHVREAVRVLRPRLTVLENVAGHRSLGFDRVLGDLAEDGMHVRWTSVRASDVGAAHQRERLFIVVTGDADEPRLEGRGAGERADQRTARPTSVGLGAHIADTDSEGRGGIRGLDTLGRDADRRGGADRPGATTEPTTLLPSPRTSDTNGAGSHGDGGPDLRTVVSLLPTPAVNDMGAGKTVEAWDEWTDAMQARHGNGNGHGEKGGPNQAGSSGDLMLPSAVQPARWGDYAAAIARWEHVLGRPAPAPTMTSTKGNPQLSPAFVEWLMGLPAGWVTDVPGITRNEALKALGNGVVWQQCAEALRVMASWEVAA